MLPIEINTEVAMRMIADDIEKKVGDKYGFVVLIFPFGSGDDRATDYISNCHREDIIKVLRENADVLENNLDIVTKGAKQ